MVNACGCFMQSTQDERICKFSQSLPKIIYPVSFAFIEKQAQKKEYYNKKWMISWKKKKPKTFFEESARNDVVKL
jgi:hypothetical protein